jgi:outer membrane murein-binding lipoprotein Lpp
MSTPVPDVDRRLRQHGADIDSLYELLQRVETKVDTLTSTVDTLAATVTRATEETNRSLTQLGGRQLQQSTRLDHIEDRVTVVHVERFDALDTKLDAILAQLGSPEPE